MPTKGQTTNKRGRLAAALATSLIFAGVTSVMGQPGTPQNAKPGKNQNSLRNWQRLDKEKDGSIFIRFDNPDPFSRVYTWRFRSTFDHPVHVDYRVDTNTRAGFPVELERTAYIPANGRTDRLGIPSYLQPNVIVERVR